jgi:Na+-driven multidrug efflux pump
MQISMAALIGNSIGSNNADLAQQIYKVCSVVAFFVVAIIVILSISFRYQIVCLFSKDEEVIEMATKVILIQQCFYFFDGYQGYLSGIIRGLG